jgi:hypothetical protein
MKRIYSTFFFLLTAALLYSQDSTTTDKTEKPIFRLGFHANLAYTYRIIKSSDYTEIIDCRNGHEKGNFSISGGLDLNFRLSNHFDFATGIRHIQTGFELNETLQLDSTIINEFAGGCNVYNFVDPEHGYIRLAFFDPRYNTIVPGYHPSQVKTEMRIRYRFLDIPLVLYHTSRINKNTLRIGLGGSVNYLYSSLLEHKFFHTQTGELLSMWSMDDNHKHSGVARFNYSAITSIGYQVNCSENYSIELFGEAQYWIRNFWDGDFYWEEKYFEHHYRASIGLRLLFDVKPKS